MSLDWSIAITEGLGYYHPPPHAHVAKAGAVLKIDLTTCKVIEIVGAISDREAKRAEGLVAKHAQLLKKEWTNIHG